MNIIVIIFIISSIILSSLYAYKLGCKIGSSRTVDELEKKNRYLKVIQQIKEKPKVELFPLEKNDNAYIITRMVIKDIDEPVWAIDEILYDLIRISRSKELVIIDGHNYYITEVICYTNIIQHEKTISIQVQPE